jgi:hypothetical protein
MSWCFWQKSGINCSEDVFILNKVNEEFYKRCTFHAIFNDNSAINCIKVQQKSFIPVNFEGSYATLMILNNKFSV